MAVATSDAYRNIIVTTGTGSGGLPGTTQAGAVGASLTLNAGFGISLVTDTANNKVTIVNTGNGTGALTTITDVNSNSTYYPLFSRPTATLLTFSVANSDYVSISVPNGVAELHVTGSTNTVYGVSATMRTALVGLLSGFTLSGTSVSHGTLTFTVTGAATYSTTNGYWTIPLSTTNSVTDTLSSITMPSGSGDINPVTGTYQMDTMYIDQTTTPLTYNPSTGTLSLLSLVTSAGLVSSGAYTGTYSDGIVLDYVTNNARISAGTGDGFTFYNNTDTTRNTLLTIDQYGNVTYVGALYFKSATIAAAGTNQGTATAITADNTYVSSGTGGVILPTAVIGREISITNNTASSINVYPASGASIENSAANIATVLPAYATLGLAAKSTTNWWTTQPVYNPGSNITITQSANGTVTWALSSTPSLGVATATSINGLTITSSTGTFTLTNLKTFAVQNSITLAGTDSTTITLPSTTGTVALNNQTMYIGTTSVAINRASANLALTGISSIALPGSTSGTSTLQPQATAGTTTFTLPTTTGTLIGSGDTGTVSNTMLANSSFYIGSTSITLGRTSANLALTGISSVAFPGSTSGTATLQATATAGTPTLSLPTTTGTLIGSGDTGTVSNTMLANSNFYIGSTSITLGRTSANQSLTGITSIDGYAANLAGGNNTTLLGAIHYQSNTNVTSLLSPNTTTTLNVLTQTGTGTNGAAPVWTSTTGTGNVVLATSPTIAGGSHTGITSLGIRDTSAAFDVTLAATSSTALTAGRTVTLDVVNAARTVKLGGNLSLVGNFTTTVGTVAFAADSGGSSSVTLPASGTLVNTGQTFYLGSTAVTVAQGTSTITSLAGVSVTGSSGTVTNATPTIVVNPGTTWTIPAGVTKCKITVIGGGGGGGANATGYGGGGGAGGLAISWLTGLTPGNTLTTTTGAAGAASSVSSGTQTITTITANAGSAGSNVASFVAGAFAAGGAGGTASGGTINVTGQAGFRGISITTAVTGAMSGRGGFVGEYGTPGIDLSGATGAGNNASGYGAGGGGSLTNATGGTGAAGAIIIEY